jgi:hypothetical protein
MPRALALVLFTLLLAGGVLAVPAARSASPDVVVSQVFAGGGNAGAPFTNDFVELFNRGSTAVDVSGWTVRPFAVRQGTISWSPLDVDNRPNSGSAMLTETGGVFGVARCVAIEPASRYLLRSSVFMAAGQRINPLDSPAFQSVSLFETTDCSGPDSGFGDSPANIAESWLHVESTFNT